MGPVIQIFVKKLVGNTNTINIRKTETISKIKGEVEYETGIRPRQQRLIFGGKELEDHRLASDYNIEKENTLILGMSMRIEGLYMLITPFKYK